jgi:cytochrome P450
MLLTFYTVTCARTVMNRPFEFHDKLILPTGSRIAVPCLAVHTDPENFQNPLEFDGFRFSKMRSASIRDGESEQSWAASTISTTNLA